LLTAEAAVVVTVENENQWSISMKPKEGVRRLSGCLMVLVFLGGVVACSVPSRIVRPEFEEGVKAGEAFAQKDAFYIQCWWISDDTDPFQKAVSYRTTLEDLLKSESFILGFYKGYETVYRRYVDSRCSP
jgi:hypothetical protein